MLTYLEQTVGKRENRDLSEIHGMVLPMIQAEMPKHVRGGKTALLMEDTNQEKNLGAHMLELPGLRVPAAKDGMENVGILREHRERHSTINGHRCIRMKPLQNGNCPLGD